MRFGGGRSCPGIGPCILLAVLVPLAGTAEELPSAVLSKPHAISACLHPGDRFMGIRLLGAVSLRGRRLGGRRLAELSGLAWDEDEERLYAISDSGGVFHLRPEFSGDTLAGVAGVAGFALRDGAGRPLRGRLADSEGLAVVNGRNGISGDSELVVSFERRPRLARYSPEGRYLGPIDLPASLSDVSNYASANQSLESVTRHPTLGWLTAPERPMRGDSAGIIRIYSSRGPSWEYPLRAAPNNALVALEALPDGALLTLERGHGALYQPILISLRRIPAPAGDAPALPPPETLAVLDSSAGWRLDNFEGLSRHRNRRFFLVSDDNQNALQTTILLYIETLDGGAAGPGARDCDRHPENAH